MPKVEGASPLPSVAVLRNPAPKDITDEDTELAEEAVADDAAAEDELFETSLIIKIDVSRWEVLQEVVVWLVTTS